MSRIRQGKFTDLLTAVAASGTITSPAKAAYTTNNQTLTISDGTHTPTIFEVTTSGAAGAGHTQVDLSAATTASDCAAAWRTAINGVTTTLTVTANAPTLGVLPLVADSSDSAHNVAITTTITAAGFSVAGMSGGVDAGAVTPVAASGVKDLEVWLHSADYTGTYKVETSHDGGLTYGTQATAAVASPGVNTVVKVPACDYLKVTTVTTAGTLSSAWAGTESVFALKNCR